MRRSLHKSFVSTKSDSSEKDKDKSEKTVRRHISIDLEKLEGTTTKMLHKETEPCKVSIQKVVIPDKTTDVTRITQSAPSRKESLPADVQNLAKSLGLNTLPSTWTSGGNRDRSKIGKYFTQYEFLGQIVQNKNLPPEDKDDDERLNFRLSIQKPHIMKLDPLEELILRTVEGADDIRQSIAEMERRMKGVTPIRKPPPSRQINANQKLFLKTEGSTGLSCFHAVDKAYKDRNDAEKLFKTNESCETY